LHRHTIIVRRAVSILLLIAATSSCTDEVSSSDPAPVSWEEFKESSTIRHDGRELYVIEEDLRVGLDELRAHYDAHIAPQPLGVISQASIVNVVNGSDDIWRNGQQLWLTYCVSSEFGDRHQRVVNDMNTATQDWENVASVNFIHLPEHDGNCNVNNPNVLFSVAPWNEPMNLAFFPSSQWFERTVWLNLGLSRTSIGTFRHELGHVLGLRHEHLGVSGCPNDPPGDHATVTPYDRSSVMHYRCGGAGDNRVISPLDAEGASSLYGPRPARPGLHSEYVGCDEGAPDFMLTFYAVRGVWPERFQVEAKRGGSGWSVIHDGPEDQILYRGEDRRTDRIRVRACNWAGCSREMQRSVRADCGTLPQ